MQLSFTPSIAANYTSPSQRIRVLSEDWVWRTIFCPNCGRANITQYGNNRPAADFYCQDCHEEYELKSKSGNVGTKIVDGAYSTMIERLGSSTNPNLFMLSYDLSSYVVTNFMVIPKHFFVPEIIEKRKPLSATAKRAGWTGCNILLNNIPESGKVFFIRNGQITARNNILSKWQKTLFLREKKEIHAKGWLLDIMRCIEKIGQKNFSIEDVYRFEKELSKLYPENNHIKPKIRQQLQVLRDHNYIEFVSRGRYQLL